MASTTFWPCETRTSTCRSFATISSGLYRFLAITVLLDVKDIPQVGPLQWGWIIAGYRIAADQSAGMRAVSQPAPAYWPRLSESAPGGFSRRVHFKTDLAEFSHPTSADRLGIRRVEHLGACLCQRKELPRKPYHP